MFLQGMTHSKKTTTPTTITKQLYVHVKKRMQATNEEAKKTEENQEEYQRGW